MRQGQGSRISCLSSGIATRWKLQVFESGARRTLNKDGQSLVIRLRWIARYGSLLGSDQFFHCTGGDASHRYHGMIGVLKMESQSALDVIGAASKADQTHLMLEGFL